MWYENGGSTSVQLSIGIMAKVSIKVFEGKHCFSLGFCVSNDKIVCGTLPFPPVFGNCKVFSEYGA